MSIGHAPDPADPVATVTLMGVVDKDEFRAFLSSPRWTAEQEQAAAALLDELEVSLAAALFDQLITPEQFEEDAPIIARTGLVAATFPVHRVLAIDGVAVAEGAELPSGWLLQRHNLYRTTTTSAAVGIVSLWPGTPLTGNGYRPFDGSVRLRYMAGWGADPGLKLAIKRKAKAIWINNHDDSMTARGMSGDPPEPLDESDWTEEELAPLGKYRRLDIISGGI